MSETAAIEHQSRLTSGDFTQVDEPLRLFATWFAEAQASEPADPNAMALATVDADGLPDVRMVLMKGYDERGFVFYSNANSQKGTELAANARAALVFYWKSLKRQVRLRGTIHQVTDEEADAYFASRPRGAQIGAWASQQSSPLESRFAFEKAVALMTAKYAVGSGAASAVLDRLSPRPGRNRVLARPAVPAARPHRLCSQRGRRALDQDQTLSVSREPARCRRRNQTSRAAPCS